MTFISDSFENLEQIPKQVVKQAASIVTGLPGQVVKSIVGQKSDSGQMAGGKNLPAGRQVDPLTGIELPSKQLFQQMQRQEKKRKTAAIPHAQQIIQGVQSSQSPKIPQYVSGKPGFNQDQAIKQMTGEVLPPKKELPPPVAAVKRKFSTGERRGGVGG